MLAVTSRHLEPLLLLPDLPNLASAVPTPAQDPRKLRRPRVRHPCRMAEPRRLGGVLALRETWCRDCEPILWCVPGGDVRFDVPGMRADGKPPRSTARKVAGAAFAVAAGGGGVGGALLGRLRSKVDGVRTFFSSWAPDEPVPVRRQRSVFELPAGTYTLAGAAVRERPRFTDHSPLFEKPVLSDGSALEFYAGPAGDLPQRMQLTRLVPLERKATR